MVFSSLVFLFIFLPLTLILYFGVCRRLRNTVLLIVSLIFYAWGEPVYVYLILFSTVTDYLHGILIERYRHQPKRARLVVLFSVFINLGLLIFFKYSTFLVTNINLILHTDFDIPQLPLPIGISFYTFQTMSYTIDVFRKEAPAKKNIIDLGAYVTMFPQLIAGPIVRYQTIANQLEYRLETEELFAKGVWRFVIGLGKKVLLANNIGLLWNQIQGTNGDNISVLMAWLGLVAFGFQIYFDFSGYSDMAIGLGYLFGFVFPENFNYPYISKSMTEFWRRWHISLGKWFRDYVYIPLGGNRKGKYRMYVNIFIVWMLTGIWHGASWNFVLWGGYFGFLIIVEKSFLLGWLSRVPSWIGHVYTIGLLIIGWGLFAFEDFNQLIGYFKVLFGCEEGIAFINRSTLYYLKENVILLGILTLASTPIFKMIGQKIMERKYGQTIKLMIMPLVCLFILIASTAYLVDSSYNPFLYFRF